MEVLRTLQARLEEKQAAEQDERHFVAIMVLLPDGCTVAADSLSSEGDRLIRVVGVEVQSKDQVTVYVGADALHFELVTIHLPPRKPGLSLV